MVLNGFMENRQDKDIRAKLLLRELSDYQGRASDKDLWTTVLFLLNGIFFRKLDFKDLLDMGDRFDKEERQNLRAICILGVAFVSRQPESRLVQLLNVFHAYLATPSLSITRFVYVQFVRSVCKTALRELFIGTVTELQDKLEVIDSVSASDTYAVQKILRNAIAESTLTPPPNIIAFLYPTDGN